MKSKPIAALLMIGLLGVHMHIAAGSDEPNNSNRDKPRKKLTTANLQAKEIADYTKWKVVNPQAFYVPHIIAIACAPPTLPPQTSTSSSHPSNAGKYIRVFVNDKGKAAMFAKAPRFPTGSVIIKEKLPTDTSLKPELLTVMIKRQPGFDTSKGDWEYLVTSGNGQKAYQRGKITRCQSCHIEQRDSDYVFRSYLPVN